MTENCNNCIWKLDGKCVNADSIHVKGYVNANILCPFWDLYIEKESKKND